MSDSIDDMKALANHKKRLRAKYGQPCQSCIQLSPKRSPTILMPGQKCRVDGHVDSRPELTDEQWSDA